MIDLNNILIIHGCSNYFFIKSVDLNVQASEQENGLDLPFDDIPTLRLVAISAH